MTKHTTISPESILGTYPEDLSKEDIIAVMKDFAAVKVFEAIQVVSEDYPNEKSKEILNSIDSIYKQIKLT